MGNYSCTDEEDSQRTDSGEDLCLGASCQWKTPTKNGRLFRQVEQIGPGVGNFSDLENDPHMSLFGGEGKGAGKYE